MIMKVMFWKEVKCVRIGEQARDKIVMNRNGQIHCGKVRW